MLEILLISLSSMIFFALHSINSSSFPKPLTPEEELDYFKKMADGDNLARNKLIEHNLRLVAHITKKYYSVTKDVDDLISIGTIGLIKAVNSFDYKKSIKFSTYASRCIQNELLMHFRSSRKNQGNEVLFSDPFDNDKDGVALIDLISTNEDIVEIIDTKIKTTQLLSILSKLSAREKEIIIMRYGLYATTPLPQREVAKKLNISRSYVSRIEKKALTKLRYFFEKSGYSDSVD